MSELRRAFLVRLAAVLPFAVTASWAQRRNEPPFGPQRSPDPNDPHEKFLKQAEKARNKERHERIKKDTDKLLELSQELKKYVDETNENIISLDVVRKAQEIEKLAKSIRDKMTD